MLTFLRSTKTHLLSLAFLVACGPLDEQPSSGSGWSIDKRIALPSGLVLGPDDSDKPGEARPQALAVHDGAVYTPLTHLLRDPGWGAAGVSHLAIHDAATLEERAILPLAIEEGNERISCRNAGDLHIVGDTVFISCSGDFDGEDGALAEVTLGANGPVVSRIVHTGGSPGAIAVSDADVWLTDLASGNLLRVSRPDFEVLNGAGGEPPVELCPAGDHWEMLSALYLDGDRGFASCFNGGQVVQFDLTTGTQFGDPLLVGDGPQSFVAVDQHLFVVDNLGATLSRITLGDTPTAERAILPLGQMPEGITAKGQLLAVSSSGDGTVTFIDATELRKTDSVDLKHSGAGSPYPWGVAFGDDDDLFVALNGSNEIVRLVRQPGEDE